MVFASRPKKPGFSQKPGFCWVMVFVEYEYEGKLPTILVVKVGWVKRQRNPTKTNLLIYSVGFGLRSTQPTLTLFRPAN
jgi:hypothetical protein